MANLGMKCNVNLLGTNWALRISVTLGFGLSPQRFSKPLRSMNPGVIAVCVVPVAMDSAE